MPPSTNSSSKSRGKPRSAGLFARVAGAAARAWSGAGSAGVRVSGPLSVGLILVLGAAWYFGEGPLRREVAEIRRSELQVRFNWPVSPAAPGRPSSRETWLPAAIQNDLVRIAAEKLSADPFDQGALEAARQYLTATGWLSRLRSVERRPGGKINIAADWRIPAAVVEHRGRQYLVAVGGEILKLPPRTPVAAGSMPVITNPKSAPPTDSLGIVYGQPWPGGDVQAAISLVRSLRDMPESKRLRGVDLGSYMSTGHLTLVSDAGARINWGSAPGEFAPGQVSAETRRARLRDILARRFDTVQKSIEIHTDVVLVDKTAARQ
ncbi:MAG: hypothetical protein SFZ24_04780 [Planctomycetota bacterium]|nr:hypothetical protein [Planctomycetota bacterium]